MLLPVSARRRKPATPTSRKIISATALPDRRDRREVDEVRDEQHEAGGDQQPGVRPSARLAPKNGGNSRSCASMPVRFDDA